MAAVLNSKRQHLANMAVTASTQSTLSHILTSASRRNKKRTKIQVTETKTESSHLHSITKKKISRIQYHRKMKVSNIVSMILASVVVLVQQQQGVLATSPVLRATPSNEEAGGLPLHLSITQKFRDMAASLKSSSPGISENPKDNKAASIVRTLPGKKKEVCPPFLKDLKKAMAYMVCQGNFGETPMFPLLCLFFEYDGVTAPNFFVESPVMAFEGIFSVPSLLTGLLINFPTGNFTDPNNPYVIVSHVTGAISTEGGGLADVPITFSYTTPYGKNLCGVDKITYLRFNNTDIGGQAVVTFH